MSEHDPKARLAFLDGIRGITAIYVVMYHCYFTEITAFDIHNNFSLAERLRVHWLGFGEEAMAVFLVISGFSLMRPVLLAGGKIEGGIARFLLHRAKRLLIPYYVVLLILLALMNFPATQMHRINVDLFAGHFPQADNFDPKNLRSHFLLFENLKYQWKFSIDPPAWGVATMWWMYVLFALVLLPLWKRLGSVLTAAGLLALTLIPHFIRGGIGDVASPWFVGIFAIGMAAAGHVYPTQTHSFPRRLWLLTSAFLFAVCAYIGLMHDKFMWNQIFAIDILVGCAAACFIVYAAECVRDSRTLPFSLSVLVNLLETKPLVALGRISYSLFLVHFPTLWMIHAHITGPMQASPMVKLAWELALGVPASIFVATVFYWAVERWFQSSRVKSKNE